MIFRFIIVNCGALSLQNVEYAVPRLPSPLAAALNLRCTVYGARSAAAAPAERLAPRRLLSPLAAALAQLCYLASSMFEISRSI